jgi:spore coat protein U-like protein
MTLDAHRKVDGRMLVRLRARCQAVALLALILFAMLGALARAGPSPQTATSTISAMVLDDCRIDGSIGPQGWTVNFGAYQMSLPVAVNFSAVLYCTKGASVSSVTLDNGLNYAASSRNMSDGLGHLFPYKLYTNACASAVTEWTGANTPSAFQDVTSTSVLTPIDGSECATIAAGINVPSGSYTDTVTITVNFT